MLNTNHQKVFEFLNHRLVSSIPPTIREICSATGIKSTSTVHAILNKLENDGLIVRDKQNARSIHITGTDNVVNVPLLGRVSAGLPILAVEQIEEYIPYSPSYRFANKQLFALRVNGESMKNAAILDSDIVVCEKTSTAEEGQIVVALIEDEATVKRFYREKFGFRLQPENDDFNPIYTAELTILGRVIACIRNYA